MIVIYPDTTWSAACPVQPPNPDPRPTASSGCERWVFAARLVSVREVGPRDGFQNEPEVIPTAEKIRLIDLLMGTGLRRIEVTSFVRPDVIPQLADATEVLEGIDRVDGVSLSVLIPNERGLDNALRIRDRFDEVSVFMSASESHNQHNVIARSRSHLTGSSE